MSQFSKFLLSIVAILLIWIVSALSVFSQTKEGQASANRSFCDQPKDLRDQLIDEAEHNKFTVRRLEFTGNTYTRDRDLRKRMVFVNEGYIFERKNLETALMRLSKMKVIYPVTMDDIMVFLDSDKKDLDVVVCIKQKPKK